MAGNKYVEERASEILSHLEKLALHHKPTERREGVKNANGNVILKGWKELAAIEVKNLLDKYPDEKREDGSYKPPSERYYLTATMRPRMIKDELYRLINNNGDIPSNEKRALKHLTTQVISEMEYFLSPYKNTYNKVYNAKVETRKQEENKITIDLTEKLNLAHKILCEAESVLKDFDNIPNKKKPNWREVSCALALCTGRRASEIHLTGKFKKIDDYHLMFSGQLKGKNRKVNGIDLKDVEFEIPTLINSQLILKGIEYLDKCGYKFSEETTTVEANNKLSRPLSREVQANWKLYDPIYGENGKKIESQNYHRFRALYYMASCVNYAQDKQDTSGDVYLSTDYAKQIMGDGDDQTLQSYRRFKNAKNGITRI